MLKSNVDNLIPQKPTPKYDEDETDCINSDNKINDILGTSHNKLKKDSCSCKNNEIQKVIIPVHKQTISLNNIQNILAKFDGSQFKNNEKRLADIQNIFKLMLVNCTN